VTYKKGLLTTFVIQNDLTAAFPQTICLPHSLSQ